MGRRFSLGVVHRFLTRLLLVHGQLSTYRLSRLIKYSFYKNIAFGFLLFFYQFYNGFSGQVLHCPGRARTPLFAWLNNHERCTLHSAHSANVSRSAGGFSSCSRP